MVHLLARPHEGCLAAVRTVARLAIVLGLAVTLSASSCEYTVEQAPPRLAVTAEDAVGSLSSPDPPVLRITVRQEGRPVQGADVRFISLDGDGDELGNIGFDDTDSNGVASVTLAGADPIFLPDILAGVRYEVEVDTPDQAAGGRATAALRIQP